MRICQYANAIMKNAFRIFIILLAVIACNACTNDETCRKNRYVSLQVSLYKVALNPLNNTLVASAWSADSISVQGIGVDSILYKNSKKISQINLNLKKLDNQTAYQLIINKVIDTLTVTHTNTTEFLSLECGCLKTYKIDSVFVTHHAIDSIQIINHQVNTDNATNIRIFNK
jgi:Family of unknown function (DUF6452)